jgi:ferredoxin
VQEPPRLRRVCDAAGAIDFQRAPQQAEDASTSCSTCASSPAFTMHQPPQGYFHVGRGGDAERRLVKAVLAARAYRRVREAEVLPLQGQAVRAQPQRADRLQRLHRGLLGARHPQRRVAQGRKGKAKGAGVPVLAAGGIVVEPHLCVGCGACSTVCPSGALAFGYPGTVDQGRKLRTMLGAYRLAGGATRRCCCTAKARAAG